MDDSVSIVSLYSSSVVAFVPFLVSSSGDANSVDILLEVGCSPWRVAGLAVPCHNCISQLALNSITSNTETDGLSLCPYELCELV